MTIICGRCKERHTKVAEVKACYAAAKAAITQMMLDEAETMMNTIVRETELAEDAKVAAAKFDYSTATLAVLKRTPVTVPGMYLHNEIVYRVKRSQSGYLYASRVELFEGKPIYTYAPGIFKTLDASDKMTVEAAEAYSLKINHCCCCGKMLTNTKSVTLGIGPVCRKNYF
jgi:uncharacterized protein DUF6011